MKKLLILVFAFSLAGCATQPASHRIHKSVAVRHHVVRYRVIHKATPAPVIAPAPVVIPAPVAKAAPKATFKRRWHFHFPHILRQHPK